MRNPFFYATRFEKRVIILLAALTVVAVAVDVYYTYYHQGPQLEYDAEFEEEYSRFIAGIRDREDTEEHMPYEQKKLKKATLNPFPFDPNTADSLVLLKLGLPTWMTNNILHYRAKGGAFNKAEDFRKIYGLTEEQYMTLEPYIRIAPRPKPVRDSIPQLITKLPTDTFPRIVKYPAGTIIDLNKADTTELKKIPGIGSAIAKRITGYRQKLGGFYSVEQLAEIELDAQALSVWFNIDSPDITKINLNKASIERIRNHPYFNFYQAKAIVEYRKKKGKLSNLRPLMLLEEFTESDVERMQHYVCFE